MLSAPGEGLIAKMDLVDITSAEAIPVDYKRGQVPDVPEGAWEPERVQLCAQGLILAENGYHCEGGVLYFIESRRRVSIAFDETLIERTRELIVQMRQMASSGVMPPPLDDSPKCPRCSLVGICLPDETSLLRESTTDGKARSVRRLLPARQDALPLYVQEQGARVGKSADQITVKLNKKVISKSRLLDTSQVCLFGNVQISAQALREIIARRQKLFIASKPPRLANDSVPRCRARRPLFLSIWDFNSQMASAVTRPWRTNDKLAAPSASYRVRPAGASRIVSSSFPSGNSPGSVQIEAKMPSSCSRVGSSCSTTMNCFSNSVGICTRAIESTKMYGLELLVEDLRFSNES
jgi:hypothetical protein